MKRTPKQIFALVSSVLLMQLSGMVCLELFPQVFQGRPLRKILLWACLLSITLPIFLKAYRYYWRDPRRTE
jgi:hypothetical protein